VNENDLRDLLGDDVPEPELERLRTVDEAMRAAAAPPEASESLTQRVLAIPRDRPRGRRRRLLGGLALAAALAAGAFAIGFVVGETEGNGGPAVAAAVTLLPTPSAPADARMVIDVLPIDAAGNWRMFADVRALPPLGDEGYYELWLAKGRRLAAPCGRFKVDRRGVAENVWLNAPYPFDDYDRWVVIAVGADGERSAPLLSGPVLEHA
jgi:hypothetical protein